MKPYQIKGEVIRHLGKLFAARLHPYPKLAPAGFREICFLHDKAHLAPSAYLRAKQLCEMASGTLNTYLVSDIDAIRDHSLVIGTKGALDQLTQAMRQRRHPSTRFLYDPVDQLLDLSKLLVPDGLIASSYRQYLWLRTLTDKPVFLLPHHADQRISQRVRPEAGFGVAYFGLEKNGYFTKTLKQQIGIFETQDHQATDWMARLADYPVHYCIRRKPEKSHSYKPATKLFIAAKVGAAVITTRDESDAELLLPPDYPFYCHSRSEKAVAEMLAFARESFGTPVFAKAVADIAQIKGWREEEQVQQLRLMLHLA